MSEPEQAKPTDRPKRGLPQAYLEFVKTLPQTDVMEALDELREHRLMPVRKP